MTHSWRGMLHDAVPNILNDSLAYNGTFDPDTWRETASDLAWQEAETRVTYTADEEKVISEYETHELAPDIDDIDELAGTQFKASEWRQAQSAYAQAIAYHVLVNLLAEAVDDMEKGAEALLDCATDLGAPEDTDITDLDVASYSCPHGWAVHDLEDSDADMGTFMVWTSKQLDGLNGVSCQPVEDGPWLSLTWDPSKKEAKADATE